MRAPWGQNFLVNSDVSKKITTALHVTPGDAVLEIGPGRGALTEWLLAETQSVTAVELDSSLAHDLQKRWSPAGLTVVEKDFLEWVPPNDSKIYKVISNLPYSVAAAILQKLLDWDQWEIGVFMVQREVAERITAQPGGKNWGLLALSIQSRAEAKRLFHVSPGSFNPQPQVVSTVIELKRHSVPRVKNLDAFFRLARAAFGQRRKTLVNSLSHGLSLDKAVISSALRAEELDPLRRPETLTVEDFDRLAKRLF